MPVPDVKPIAGTAEEIAREARRKREGMLEGAIYAHKPALAPFLNGFLSEVCRAEKNVIGVGTVFPGEPDARKIVREAIEVHGLRGIKLHCHVQGIAIDDPKTLEVLRE